ATGRPFVPDWMRSPRRSEPAPAAPRRTFVPEWMREPENARSASRKPILIRGAHCVIPGCGLFTLDVRLQDGLIHSLGVGLPHQGCDIVSAEGKYLIPGIVDPHTHLGLFVPFDVEAFTETRSALLNGVTTMGV